MTKLILASQSPRRRQILKDHGIKFKVIPGNIDEESYENLDPVEMVETLSLLKARKIAETNPDSIILAADTTVVLEKKMLSKPKSKDIAIKMLEKLSGMTHIVITGFCILDTKSGKLIISHEKTRVTFKKLEDKDINYYVENYEVMDKAGSYAIQEGAGSFVGKMEGDYLNVVGLPSKVFNYLAKFGIK